MKLSILIIFFVTVFSNYIYIYFAPSVKKEKTSSNIVLYTYRTPDNTIWINKDNEALQRMRDHYIEESDSIINRLEAEKEKIIPHNLLGPKMQRTLFSDYNINIGTQDTAQTNRNQTAYFMISNSIVIVTGFTALCLIVIFRNRMKPGPATASIDYKNEGDTETDLPKPEERFDHIYEENIESVKVSVESKYSQTIEKTKEIVCEVIHLINKYSYNCAVAKSEVFESFTAKETSKIMESVTINDFLEIESEIKEAIPSHFQKVRNLVEIKFDEIRAIVSSLAKDFESVTKSSTSFSSEVESSMTHIVKAIKLDEIKEIRKRVELETSELRKTITIKQEKDAETIESLSYKIETMNKELTTAKEETLLDELTQIYNRKALDKKLNEICNNNMLKTNPFTLIMADIDYFKKVNDDYGHIIGDEVLKRVAKTIKGTFRINDFVARYGGEEFAIIIDSVDKQFVKDVCERFRQDVENINFKVEDKLVPISISAGVAYHKESDTIEGLIKRADKALYLAKHSGRNVIKTEVQLETS